MLCVLEIPSVKADFPHFAVVAFFSSFFLFWEAMWTHMFEFTALGGKGVGDM